MQRRTLAATIAAMLITTAPVLAGDHRGEHDTTAARAATPPAPRAQAPRVEAPRPAPAPVRQVEAPRHYTMPVQHAAPVERAPVQHAAPVERAAPVQHYAPVERTAPVRHAAPVEHAAPVQHAAPVERAAPVQRYAPVERTAPVQHTAPVERYAPVERSAPARHAAPIEPRNTFVAPRTRVIEAPRTRVIEAPRSVRTINRTQYVYRPTYDYRTEQRTIVYRPTATRTIYRTIPAATYTEYITQGVPVSQPVYVTQAYSSPLPAWNIAYAPPVVQYIGVPQQYNYVTPWPVAMWSNSDNEDQNDDNGGYYNTYNGYNAYNGYNTYNGYDAYNGAYDNSYPNYDQYANYGYNNGYPAYGYQGPAGNATVTGVVVAHSGSSMLLVTPDFKPVIVDDSAASQMGYVPGQIQNGQFVSAVGFNTGSGFIATAVQ